MHDTVAVHTTGSAAVAVVTEEFIGLAATMAANAGYGALRVLSLPYPLESRSREEVHEIARDAFPRLLELLGAL